MKKVLCLVLSVVLFSLSFSFVSSHSASADSVFDFSLTSVLDYTRSTLLSYTQSLQKRIVAARSFYFYIILNDGYSSGLSIFDSSGQKFSDDILNFYYDQYCTTKSAGDIYNSDGDVFIQAAGFTDPWSLRLCCFSHGVSDNLTLYPDDMEKPYFKQYYNTELARYLIAQGETATDPNPGKSGLDIAPGYVSSEELVEGIEKDNTTLTPKSSGLFLNSYRTDTYYFEGTTKYDYFSVPIFCLYQDPSSRSSLQDLYVIPFYLDDEGTYYYLKYQLHLYYTDFDSEVGSLALRCDVYLHSSLGYVLDDSLSGDVLYCSADTKPYQVRALVKSKGSTFRYVSESEYNSLANTHIASVPFDELGNFYTADESQSLFIYDLSYESYACFRQFYKNNKYKNNDLGFICSTDMISTTYSDIDTTKIPANQIVTINGDTIYNYTITNPETGDSSKFGDYITNNYTYITNNYGGSESGGSSGSGVSGNVTVGGSIDVGGSVGVDINVNVPDININVNGNGGAGGSGSSIANPDDFTSADNVDLNKYYDEAVEQSTGFQKFLKDFFGFLPAELLGVILFAVAMAIVCRVFGR